MVWEAFKLHARSILSRRINRLKASSTLLLRQASEKLVSIMNEFALKPTPSNVLTLKLQTRIVDQLHYEKAKQKHFFSRQRVFEQGERAGKLLAYLAHHDARPPVVVSLLDPQNSPITDPASVAETFRSYYADLYTSQVKPLYRRLGPSCSTYFFPICLKLRHWTWWAPLPKMR